MGVDAFRASLRRHQRIAIDTSIFIYQLEANPRYIAYSDALFLWLEGRGCSGVTSTITMTELLVQPYRDRDNDLADQFYALLSTYPHLEWVAPSLEIADLAARLRAVHRFRTPDAIQAATAIQSHATALITNDAVFKRIDAFETVVLDETR